MTWEHVWNVARLLLLAAGVALCVLFGWRGVAVVALAVALHAVEQFTARRRFEVRLKGAEAEIEGLKSTTKKLAALLEGGVAVARKPGF